MREKLLDLMKSEGLKPSQLAEILGVNPAGISHILAGRNKPGFDFLQKILRRFPRINPDWLLLDSNQMYRNETNNLSGIESPESGNCARIPFPADSEPSSASPASEQQPAPNRITELATTFPAKEGATVSRIIVLYEDRTFESFTPTR